MIACSGGMPHCSQMCSKAPGLGLYGLNSLLKAGQKGLSVKCLSWKHLTLESTLRVTRPLQCRATDPAVVVTLSGAAACRLQMATHTSTEWVRTTSKPMQTTHKTCFLASMQ